MEDNEFISNIFFRLKKDGRVGIILNLKSFNKHFLKKSISKWKPCNQLLAMRLVISDRFICQKLFIQLRSENQTGVFSGFGIRALNTSSQH